MTRLFRAAILVCAALVGSSARAGADIIVTPFVGKTFAAQTTLQTAEGLDTQKWIVGGAAGWLGAGLFGAELDFGYVPRFFESDILLNRPGSNATSLTGNVLVAVPLSVTRESLRPYFTAGMGLLHAGVNDIGGLAEIDRDFLALSVGGGAIGFLNNRAGVRFDLRRIRTTATAVDTTTGETEPRLGFWRLTFGVALRY